MSAQYSAEGRPRRNGNHLSGVPDDWRNRRSRWEPVDPGPYLDGTYRRPEPEIGRLRSDHRAMLYPGKDHIVYGPQGSGKTMLAVALCADIICDTSDEGQDDQALYVHFEEPDGMDTFDRLRHVYTVPPDPIRERFRFVAPRSAARAWEIDDLAQDGYRLVVLDGANEALTLHGRGDTYSPDGWARFRQLVIMPFLRAGSAVVVLDHVSRDDEGAYVGPAGTVHKINAMTGAAFYLRPHKDADADHRGVSWVLVTKDRPGSVKRAGIRRPSRRGMTPATYWGAMITDVRGDSPNPLWIAPPRQWDIDVMNGDEDDDDE